MRTAARETLFKLIFSAQFTDTVSESLKNALFKADNLDEKDVEYCTSILKIIGEHKEDFTELLDNHSRMFPESRLFPADRSILLIALAEIFYFGDVPHAVSVNEAANIASKFSSPKSASFVSGILAEVIREQEGV